MRLTLFICSFVLIIFTCCVISPQTNQAGITILNPKKSQWKIDITHFIEDLQFIPLEDKEVSYLNIVQKLFVYKDKFILRPFNSDLIYIFNRDGKFEQKIRGESKEHLPMGLSNISEFGFDLLAGYIYIVEMNSSRIIIYDLDKGKVINTVSGNKVHNLFIGNEFAYGLCNEFEKGFVKIFNKSTLEMVDQVIIDSAFVNFAIGDYPMRRDGDKFFLNMAMSDTIYQFFGREYKPIAVIGSGHTSIRSVSGTQYVFDHIMKRDNNESFNEILASNGRLSVFEHYLWINLVDGKYIIWDTKKGNSIYFDYHQIHDHANLLINKMAIRIYDKDDSGYVYTSTLPNKKFFDAAHSIAQQKDHPLNQNVTSFLAELKRKENYENPIILRFKLNYSLFEKLFEN